MDTKTRSLLADRFLADLSLQGDFESLIQMVQLPYLQDISKQIADNENFGEFSEGRGFQSLFGNSRSKECQKAFLERLIQVTRGDKNILLAFASLRGWWKTRDQWRYVWDEYTDEERQIGLDKMCGYKPHRLCRSIIWFLTPTYLPRVEPFPESERESYTPPYTRAHIFHIKELRAKYEFVMSFDSKILSSMLSRLVSKLETFGALRQLYGSKQHVNDVGVVLLAHACDFATTSEELILVTRWLLNANRAQTVHLKKRLKPLLKKLIATL